ncbi:hypothetical protein [Nocardia terpenica]|uniref:hypothetical protein n=1 Tax=Nocardia terpenica TaxID=455432 RepID=UPI00142E80DC|nr:hypothetical protein [Nocardia terpenica]
MQQRRSHDYRPAAAVLGVVAALIAIPAALAVVVPEREDVVLPDTEITVTAPGETPDTVTFPGPPGWSRRPTGDPTTAVLTAPGGAVLLVNAVNGVTDFPAAADWRRKVLGLQAFPVEFDGGQLTTRSGFAGPTCVGVDRVGQCAIVGHRNLAVSVLVSGDMSGGVLSAVVEALRVKS